MCKVLVTQCILGEILWLLFFFFFFFLKKKKKKNSFHNKGDFLEKPESYLHRPGGQAIADEGSSNTKVG